MYKKLDLHGIRHEDVRNEVIRFIEENWQKEEELEIVTGNSYDMRKLVAQVCAEYKLMYTIGDWFGTNKGCMIVYLK